MMKVKIELDKNSFGQEGKSQDNYPCVLYKWQLLFSANSWLHFGNNIDKYYKPPQVLPGSSMHK